MVLKTVTTITFAMLTVGLVMGCTGSEGPAESAPAVYLGQASPGKTPELFGPGSISGELDVHSYPVFSPDGKEVYWSAFRQSFADQKIYCMKNESGVWSSPELAPFMGEMIGGNPVFSPDGERIYFNARRPPQQPDTRGPTDLWYVQREGQGWSEPVLVGLSEGDRPLHSQVCFGGDGYLYFPAEREESKGGADIYRIRLEGDTVGPVEELPGELNGETHDVQPYIAPDGSYMIFVSLQRDDCMGWTDLYISFRNEDGSWTEAKNLGAPINSPETEMFPYVTSDGKYFFFMSARNGKNHVYWVDASVIDDIRPE